MKKNNLFINQKIDRKSLRYILIFLFSAILVSGCTQKLNEYSKFNLKPKNIEDVKKLDMSQEESSISYGIVNDDGIVETNKIYFLNGEESFKRFINIENFLGVDCEFSVLTFVNYIQSDFLVENEKDKSCTVNIQNKKEVFIPLEISDLNNGYNDVIFLIIPFANDSGRNMQERFEAFQPVYLRCTVIVGDNDYIKQPELMEFSPMKGESGGIYLSDDDKKTQQYQTIETYINDKLNIYITLDNTYENYDMISNECVVILLRNLEQMELLESSYLYVKVPSDKKIIIPYEQINYQTEYCEYLVVQINRPYEVIDSYGIVEDLRFSNFTGVKVLEKEIR